jgi:hypothetical protein
MSSAQPLCLPWCSRMETWRDPGPRRVPLPGLLSEVCLFPAHYSQLRRRKAGHWAGEGGKGLCPHSFPCGGLQAPEQAPATLCMRSGSQSRSLWWLAPALSTQTATKAQEEQGQETFALPTVVRACWPHPDSSPGQDAGQGHLQMETQPLRFR